MKNDLFNETLLKKYSAKFKLTHKQKENVREYVEMIEKEKFKGETQNYLNFYDMILKDILGYERANVNFDQKVDDGAGRSEFVLKSGNKKFMVVELKGQGTDLDKKQSRQTDTRTPVDQAFGYAIHTGDVEWILLSNYNEFRLYNYHEKTKYISFNAEKLADNEKLKEFLVVFSKESHINTNYIDRVHHETQIVERKLENEFYKLYNETRLMLIKELEEHKSFDRIKAVHYAQLILNRYMFICFAEDIDLLPPQISISTITDPIKSKNVKRNSIWYSLNDLFLDIYESNPEKDIFDYNGGQFKEDIGFIQINDFMEDKNFFNETYQNWKFEDYSLNIDDLVTPYNDKINPIYKNLLTISSFDFSSDLDVNILGHIFENSIGDLEELKENAKGRRKKEGIFYTPNYITDYLCRNTIIPYLSKDGNSKTVPELIQEYSLGQEIEILESNLMNIKIVDLACGSGAFLNKASDILLEIHKSIYDFKKSKYTSTIETKGGKGKDKIKRTARHAKLDSFFDEISARRTILINNIYGVDLNEESVEITKLALFLKVCQKDKKLPEIENNIRCGNSLIDDPEYTDKSFNWEKEFPEIFKNGGFDIVIGNPPWGAKLDTKSKNFINKNYNAIEYQIDTYVVFMEKGFNILKDEGFLGFIIPSTWLSMHYFKKIRQLIITNTKLEKSILFRYQVFENVTAETSILVYEKEISELNHNIEIKSVKNKLEFQTKKLKNVNQSFWQKSSDLGFNISFDQSKLNLVEKIFKESVKLKEIGKITSGIVPYEAGKGNPRQTKEDVKNRIYDANEKENKDYKLYIVGRNIKKYVISPNSSQWIKFGDCLAAPRKSLDFTRDKIVIRQTSDHIIAAIDNTGYLNLKSVHNAVITNKSLSYKYLLPILNSRLIDFIYNFLVPEIGRVFAEVKAVKLMELPIYPASHEEQKPLILKADLMLELHQEFQDEINSFNDWLMNTFEIDKLSQKLDKYYELSFDEFLNEVKKKKVDVKSRDNYQTLKQEFEKSITAINPLIQQITETDSEIDQMVYELYDLTNEEIKIIEDTPGD
jgi:hypothetical protein